MLGGFLTQHLDWSLIFWINIPLGFAALGMTANALKRLPFHARKHRLDLLGAVLMMAASVALLLALSWGGQHFPWISPQIGALLAASAVLWSLFAWRLAAAAEPFLPLTVLANPVVRCAALAGACNMGTLVGMTIFVPLYFEVVRHFSASESGLALIPLMGATVLFSTITGRLMVHVAHYKHLAIAGMLVALLGARRARHLAGVDADRAGAHAVLHHRLRHRRGVSGVDGRHAERGGAVADGYHHRRRQFLPRLVLGAGGGDPRRHRARRLGGVTGVSIEMLARAASSAELNFAFRFVFLACALVLGFGMAFLIAMEERPLRGPGPSASAEAPTAPATQIPAE